MNKVVVMNEDLSNKIAAGEVIEKIMNVVKELVENSIDANSTEIKVELIDSGIKEIKISDNGSGMSREDATKAFLRHATSKLINIDDLFSINTLGFRGEAIPSIASISKVTLETNNSVEQTKVVVDAGILKETGKSNIDLGTVITVNDLFYNTPVRFKYLGNLYIELANTMEYINKMAISFPNIRFILINNNKVMIKTEGKGQILKVVNEIYGLEVAKKMVNFDRSNEDYHIFGYISSPEIVRSNRNSITVLVNNRYIKNNVIINSILEGYHTYMMISKYPVVIINILVNPSLIDVNIHPTKMDIKFSKIESLKELIKEEISKILHNTLLIPEVKNKEEIKDLKLELEEEIKEKEIVTPNYIVEEQLFKIEENSNKFSIKHLKFIGIALSTYIICENEEGICIIDQHAAAERINYEKYYNNFNQEIVNKSILLVPLKIELSNNDYIIFNENKEIFLNLGFSYEEFGINTILIREHPSYLGDFLEEKINKIIEIIIKTEAFSKDKFTEKLAITLACKTSIKANDYISKEDVNYLLNELSKCNNPYHCPHGRPTIINYSKYELERLFKRSI